jgi:DNA repair protein RadD
MYTLRPYQQEAVRKMLRRKNQVGNELIVIATGGGKSLIIAEFAHKLSKPVLILQPSKELLEQNVNKMLSYVSKDEVGVFSASMNSHTINTFTFATIGSIYKKPELFSHFDTVILDECDLLSPKDQQSMYMKFFSQVGHLKVYGLTATPFRLDTFVRRSTFGDYESVTLTRLINRMRNRFWHRVIVNVNYCDLLAEGYLVPLEYVDQTILQHSQIPKNSGSDFDLDRYVEMIDEVSYGTTQQIAQLTDVYKSVLVFCATIKQATQLANYFADGAAVVTSETKKTDRNKIITDFRTGVLKMVFNVNVLTVGFDHPSLDCIVMLRPTRSIRLYTQMLGRGTRLAEGKNKCTIVDFAGNVATYGKLETLQLEKIDRKWELISEKGSWHLQELSSFRIRR